MTTRSDKLAFEIATALDDVDALSLHEKFTKKYSEAFLRKKLMRVLSIPDRKIRTSRAALFTYLIQQHEIRKEAKGREEDEGDYDYVPDNHWD